MPEVQDSKDAVARHAHGRARDGAAFLDEKLPDWTTKITKSIDVTNEHTCILGQLFDTYLQGFVALGLKPGQEIELGFQCYGGVFLSNLALVDHYYKELSRAWEEERKIRIG